MSAVRVVQSGRPKVPDAPRGLGAASSACVWFCLLPSASAARDEVMAHLEGKMTSTVSRFL